MNGEQEYTKAFNNGYLLAKYEPVLLKSILIGTSKSNNYLEGLADGKDEYEYEQLLDLRKIRNNSKDRGLHREE